MTSSLAGSGALLRPLISAVFSRAAGGSLRGAAVAAGARLLPAVQGRFFRSGGPAGHEAAPHSDAAVREDPVTRVRKSLKDFINLPWELDMPPERAAQVLGSFLGLPSGALAPGDTLDLDRAQLTALLEATTLGAGDKALESALFSHADAVTSRIFGNEVYNRGIVEFSNVCANDCGYCGIRKHQRGVHRYTMPVEEVVAAARWAYDNRMGTLMLQAGELRTPQRLAYLTEVVSRVREATVAMDLQQRGLDPQAPPPPDLDPSRLGLCVALSVGELPEAEYAQLFAAGARRYLLRIETSNPALYAALHPAAMTWEARVAAMEALKRVGFQLGTGVMVGLPGQTLSDLAGDIRFFKDTGANMIGMGPYITEPGTPVAGMWEAAYGHLDKKTHMAAMFDLTTRMNALARIVLGGANIAATTALQALNPNGREIALRRGANIVMPILTDGKYRAHYQLYEGKPCITDTADECRKCLNARVGMIGKRLRMGIWGDPPNFGHGAGGGGAPAAALAGSGLARGLHTSARGLHTSARASRPAGVPEPRPAVDLDPPAPPSARAAGPATGSDVPRVNIGMYGRMNAGKSTLMNVLTRQETSIVDATPGTTADVKVSLLELHDIGPAKLFDTAGIDEEGELGRKKRRKTLGALHESDVALVVVDCERAAAASASAPDAAAAAAALRDSLRWEAQLVEEALRVGAVPLLLLNARGGGAGGASALGQRIRRVLDEEERVDVLEVDLAQHAAQQARPGSASAVADAVAAFVQAGVARSRGRPSAASLPRWTLSPDAAVFLNIPMDAETPSMRLLRPQALVQEEAIRHWATTTAYRMDLARARSADPALVADERARFQRALAPFVKHPGPKLLVTDSQAIDIVHPWTLDASGAPLIPITTFSIAMVQRQSGGQLPLFAEGLAALRTLRPGDRVLVAEACNHNRITDSCNDIGMVQIPNAIERCVSPGVHVAHAFGREFPDMEEGDLGSYKLAIHCGGCMIDPQKMRARVRELADAGVPVTNYGLFLAHVHHPHALQRCLEPWEGEGAAAAPHAAQA